MNKKLKKFIIPLALIMSLITSYGVKAGTVVTVKDLPQKYIEKRLDGATRIETSVNIAKEIVSSSKIDNVVLVSGDNFPDGLSASVLAKKLNAPILLTGSIEDSQSVFDFLKSNVNQNANVYIIGGTGAIGDDFVSKIKDLGLNNIKRIYGTDRYDTCKEVDNALGVTTGTPIVVASGENFPDALSISSVAAAKGYPIVLVSKNDIDSSLLDFIKSKNPSKIFIIGGTVSVSGDVKNTIQSATNLPDESIIRIFGADRYQTSLAIAKYFNLASDTITFATGKGFADALAGSVYAADKHTSLLLIDKESFDKQKEFVKFQNYPNKIYFGGQTSISTELEKYFNGESDIFLSDMEKDWKSISPDVPRRLYSYPYCDSKIDFSKNKDLKDTDLIIPYWNSERLVKAMYNNSYDKLNANNILYFYNPYRQINGQWPEDIVNPFVNDEKNYKVSSTAEFITDESLVYSADYNMICRGTMRIKFDDSTDQEFLNKYGIKAGQWYEKDMEISWQILAYRVDGTRTGWDFSGESVTNIKDLSGFMLAN